MRRSSEWFEAAESVIKSIEHDVLWRTILDERSEEDLTRLAIVHST